jgi:hypothetical protein
MSRLGVGVQVLQVAPHDRAQVQVQQIRVRRLLGTIFIPVQGTGLLPPPLAPLPVPQGLPIPAVAMPVAPKKVRQVKRTTLGRATVSVRLVGDDPVALGREHLEHGLQEPRNPQRLPRLHRRPHPHQVLVLLVHLVPPTRTDQHRLGRHSHKVIHRSLHIDEQVLVLETKMILDECEI